LQDFEGAIVASNDDFSQCGYCSQITYTTSTASTFTLIEGCYGSKYCSVAFTVSFIGHPTSAPTDDFFSSPSSPPTVSGVVVKCASYSATNTGSATSNTVPCVFNAILLSPMMTLNAVFALE
jgi:hypothetical protein